MARDLEQGEEYDEYFDDESYADEELEDDDVETVYDTFYGIPKKFVYIGAAAFIVLIIAIFVFSSRKSDDSPKTDTDTTEDESTELFDYNPSGETTDQLFDYVEPTAQTATEQVVDTYDMEDLSTEDMRSLRSYGYTGDEIEYSIAHGFSVGQMIERAQYRMDKANEASWLKTSDVAGEEYKYLMNMTYLGQEAADTIISQEELDWTLRRNITQDVVINCDYEKCPTQGMQLYLKCRIAKNTYYWYPVKPERWCTLPDSGNIVLRITFNVYGDGTYIIDAVETDSTLDTIDSSNDIEDVTDGTASEEAAIENAEDAFLTGEPVVDSEADVETEDVTETESTEETTEDTETDIQEEE